MAYTTIRYSDLITGLSTRLSDPAHDFWSEAEIKSYIIEALRTWQVFSTSYNVRVTMPTVANQIFYNLFSLSQLSLTVTDRELVRDTAFALQEPVDPTTGAWIGTEQFTESNVYQAIQQRRDKFLLETGLVLTESTVNGPSPTVSTVDLAQNVIDVRHAIWKNGSSGPLSLLWRLDKFTATSKPALSFTPDIPTDYLTYPLQPLQMELLPPPLTNGTINLLTVNSGAALDPDNASILGIPDDFCWVVKFGALADLFASDGPGQDIARAAYCEARWSDGISLARITNFVHLGQNNSVPWFVDSLQELNTGDPTWVSRTPGSPETLAVAGNMVAAGPIADAVYSMTFDIMPKFIIPTSPSDYIQLGPETIDVIIDYAQHLATLKEGATEVQRSQRGYENFVKLAAVQNDRLRAQSQNFDALNSRSNRFKKEHPRRSSTLKIKELEYAND
jgi:hypothetical protein